MKKNLKYIIFFAIIIVIAIILQLSNQATKPSSNIEQVTGQVQDSIDLKFSFSETATFSVKVPYAETLSTNLVTITQSISDEQDWAFESKDYGEMGFLVTKIGEKANGQDQKYWQFFVNGEQPMVSVDKFIPKKGDQIEWRFAESKF